MQSLSLLHIRGLRGRAWARVGEPALRFQASRRATAALIGRRVAMWLATEPRDAAAARGVEVCPTPLGEPLVSRIAAQQRGVWNSPRSVVRSMHVGE